MKLSPVALRTSVPNHLLAGAALAIAGVAGCARGPMIDDNEVAELRSDMQQLRAEVNELQLSRTLNGLVNVIEQVSPSTVKVEGEAEALNWFTGESTMEPVFGSGVIIVDRDNNKYILTSTHVIDGSAIQKEGSEQGVYRVSMYTGSDSKEPVTFETSPVILKNGELAISSTAECDVALLAIPSNIKLPENAGIKIRDIKADPLHAGEIVIAIGNPLGIRDYISFGIISNPDRDIPIDDFTSADFVESTAPIYPGNSGGPLVDMEGRLIGINAITPVPAISAAVRADTITSVLDGWGISV